MNVQFHLEQVVVAWLQSGARSNCVPVLTGGDQPDGPGTVREWPVGAVLHELWDDARPVPAGPAAVLALPQGASFAHAARLLTCLTQDDLFPARTHAEAVRYLRMLPAGVVRTYHRAIADALVGSSLTPPAADEMASA